MKYIVTINGKNYEVEVEKGEASIIKTSAAAPAAAPVQAVQTEAQATSTAVVQGAGEAVKAPMPGTILDIKVNHGAAVKKGDTLLILEAMKMENEISSPRDGVVARVTAVKGASVATGDILVVLQ